jgi:NAD(P) transhydrogenase subunit beta
MNLSIVNLAYLIASVLFIFGLKGLTHPRTAVRGNMLGSLGMLLAIVVTLWDRSIISYEMIILGFIIGAAVGGFLAVKIEMTAMPQLVAVFNGFGGGASALVAGAALVEAVFLSTLQNDPLPGTQFTVATAASGLIGAVTFWGSLIAFAKLQGLISEASVLFKGQVFFNGVLLLACIGLGAWLVIDPTMTTNYLIIIAIASVLGVLLVIPVGGADMPVVISMLNSYSGIAAAATGFVLENNVLIIAGTLVGASGYILTAIMCKAMNRSLANVMVGGMETGAAAAPQDDIYTGKIKATSADEVAMLFDGSRRVVIVPGYGMAVAQAQHAVRDLTNLLEGKGIEVEFAIHPVAGRMPGHMNVLLAEANIEYDKLKEMDEANAGFRQTDVSIIIGANDVVNPVAREDANSPIAGMPILNVDESRFVVVVKRSLSPGFAGIPNPLFAADNTLMFFNDAKKAMQELVTAVKEM